MLSLYRLGLEPAVSDVDVPALVRHLTAVDGVVRVHLDSVGGCQAHVYYDAIVSEPTLAKRVESALQHFRYQSSLPSGHESGRSIRVVPVDIPPAVGQTTVGLGTQTTDATPQLLEQDWVMPLPGPDWGYGEEMTALVEGIDRSYTRFIRERSSRCRVVSFSPFCSMEHLERMGYFESAPMQLYFASHLNGDASAIPDGQEPPAGVPRSAVLDGHIDRPSFGLQPAPCLKIYFSQEGTSLPENRTYTLRGCSFRSEGKRAHLLERLLCFSMREFVYLGLKPFVLQARNDILEWTLEWLGELGVEASCELADDPFFLSRAVDGSFEVPSQIKHEIRAQLPYRELPLSIASFDTHGTFFSSTFEFALDGAETTWSGCMGIGLDRCAWSVVQQFGTDVKHWPSRLRDLMS